MNAESHIDETAVLDWCAQNIAGFGVGSGISKFPDGQSNPTYRINATSGVYVLRSKPPGKLLNSAHMVEREYRIMHALADTNVPVPKMFGIAHDDDSPIGRAFFVLEHIDGRVFWGPDLVEVPKHDRSEIYYQMAATLAHLHSVDPADVGLNDFGKPGNYFERQIERWTKQYLASATDPAPEMLQIIKWLERTIPADDGQIALVHGDYRIDNMIFDASAPRLLALIDWELSTLGHPLADLAYQCMQLRLPSVGVMAGLGGVDRQILGIPSEQAYVDHYCRVKGVDGLENWPFYIVFSAFRLIAILQGVVRRAADGNASNPARAVQLASVMPQLTHLAMQEAEI